MALLLVPIAASTVEQVREAVGLAFQRGADGIELRLDGMEEIGGDELAQIAAAVPPGGTVIATLRSRAEGGEADGGDEDRVTRLMAAAAHADAVDVEHALWQRLDADSRTQLCGEHALILSRHDLAGRPSRLTTELLDMVDVPEASVVKLAWNAKTIRETLEAFELMRESPKPIIAICMGEAGALSRILARKFGGYATFASLGAGRASAAGQFSIEQMKRLYRWDAIHRDTDVYGVIGHPVAHSLSPAVFNAAFEARSVNAVYCPLLVEPGYESFKAFMVEAVARPWFGLRGVSVTAPHKENALRFSREIGGRVEAAAARIGAVNTLALDAGGGLRATNTDADAAREALLRGSGLKSDELAGLAVAILGAGGVARACVAGLTAAGAKLTVYNRSRVRAGVLAAEFGCAWKPWEDRDRSEARVVINCTTVGQGPRTGETPMELPALRPGMIVFDTIYRPQPTRLVMEAHTRGCRTIDGLEMFLLQAAAQWNEWLGQPAPHEAMRLAAVEQLSGDSTGAG